jgi:uncharacterized 2Fe-2S/4Fe-4S cluster protein (DUF4445 family)
MATVYFNGEPIELQIGETLFTAADRSAQGTYEIASSCQRTGSCKECLVQVKTGHEALTPPSEHEAFLKTRAGDEPAVYRLACQARVMRPDAEIVVETFKRRLEIATEGTHPDYAIEPWVRCRGGAVFCGDDKLAEYTGPIHGLAIDVGTSTVVLHLVNLETGETKAVRAMENPQRYGGSDVTRRISYDHEHPGQLHRTIIAHVNDLIAGLPVPRDTIFAVTVVGNPTMRDLFFGLDVRSIGVKPFVSITQAEMASGRRDSTAVQTTSSEVGLLTHPAARIYGLPVISHHVGADTAAALATLPIERHEHPFLLIDVGTNTEVAVGNRDRLIVASCPAGPAFEGGRVVCGMPAAEGAIAAVRRGADGWRLTTIGQAPPRGLCGSGLIDLLAELRAAGAMDSVGRLEDNACEVRLAERPRVVLTRRDASELAQAKAANALGQHVLLRTFGVRASQLECVYLAGAFANQMDLANAMRIGMLVPVEETRVRRIGNAAIEGAKAALLNASIRTGIEKRVLRTEHIELETQADFFDLFAQFTLFEPLSRRGEGVT